MSAKSEFGPLLRMMPVDVMLPTTAGLTLALPASGCAEKDHNPFGEPVTMTGICDQMLVLSSLQKPKKVRLLLHTSSLPGKATGPIFCARVQVCGPFEVLPVGSLRTSSLRLS